jgi:hypothetical protein
MAEMKEKGSSFDELIKNENTTALLGLARLTEAAERYEEMCVIMGKIVSKKSDAGEALDVEERNMLSVAYKNVVGSRRAAWRSLKGDDEEAQGDAQKDPELTKAKEAYRAVVETELFAKCKEVLDLLKNNLLQSDTDQTGIKENFEKATPESPEHTDLEKQLETQVFYLKMSGDYYRYLAEFKKDDDDQHKNQAEAKYIKALTLSEALAPTHPTRLGLALNASVCYWEIMKKPTEACQLAKKAFDEAIQKLDSLSDSTYKDSTLIMQLLRDNLTIWTNENERGDNPGEEHDA